MVFKIRNWNVELRKNERRGEVWYTGKLDFEGKSGRCGSGWTGNSFMVQKGWRISYDFPETVPNYLEEAILNKCEF